MKQFFAAAAIAAFLTALPQPSVAQEINIKTVDCKTFSALPEESKLFMMAWFQGFFADDQGEMMLVDEEVKGDTQVLSDYCSKNPAETVMDALEKAFQ